MASTDHKSWGLHDEIAELTFRSSVHRTSLQSSQQQWTFSPPITCTFSPSSWLPQGLTWSSSSDRTATSAAPVLKQRSYQQVPQTSSLPSCPCCSLKCIPVMPISCERDSTSHAHAGAEADPDQVLSQIWRWAVPSMVAGSAARMSTVWTLEPKLSLWARHAENPNMAGESALPC